MAIRNSTTPRLRRGGIGKNRQMVETSWPNFKSDAPPKDWELQHNRAHRMTIHEMSHGYTAQDVPQNRPVPRLASHDFFRPIHGGTDYYFA